MATPFTEDGYTDQQADAIHQALIEAHLKSDANWPRLFSDITMLVSDVSEGHAHPEALPDLFRPTIRVPLRATQADATRANAK